MEIALASRSGIPEDAIISIRSGSVRRQGSVSTEKPFRFPQAASDADCVVKVDIMQNIGSGYLVMRPGQMEGKQYEVILNEGLGMACELSVKPADGDRPSTAEPKDDPKALAKSAEDAKTYLENTGLIPFVQGVLQVVSKQRPDDPFAAVAKHFLSGYNAPAPQGAGSRAGSPKAAPASPTKDELDGFRNALETGLGIDDQAPGEEEAKAGFRAALESALGADDEDEAAEDGAAKAAPPAEGELGDFRNALDSALGAGDQVAEEGEANEAPAAEAAEDGEAKAAPVIEAAEDGEAKAAPVIEDGVKEEATEEAAAGVEPVSPNAKATAALGVPAAAIAAAGGLLAAATTEDKAAEEGEATAAPAAEAAEEGEATAAPAAEEKQEEAVDAAVATAEDAAAWTAKTGEH